ncbi:MAG: tetratricopeptide repeat protein [Phycisphaeraceae bacterium]|nr:tetratricopeptide repeat protein [Phycisphaeraceae bacterium]
MAKKQTEQESPRAAVGKPPAEPAPDPQAVPDPMADTDDPLLAAEEAVDAEQVEVEQGWSQAWHLPVLLLGLGLMLLGVYGMRAKPTPFDYPQTLDVAQQMIKAQDFEGAKGQLDLVAARLNEPDAAGHLFRFNLVQGDLIYEQQLANRWDNPESHQQIVNAYSRASELSGPLDDTHLIRWTQALVALGREDEAMRKMEQVSEAAGRRHLILQQIIQRRLDAPGRRDSERILPLLARFSAELSKVTDAGERRRLEVWATAQRAMLMFEAEPSPMGPIVEGPDASTQPAEVGAAEQVRDYLLRRLAVLADGGPEQDLVELMLPLARAYQKLGAFDDAWRWFDKAAGYLDKTPENPLNAEALVGLGQVALSRTSDPAQAVRYFADAVENYPGTTSYIQALIGLGDCRARASEHDQARDVLGQAVEQVRNRQIPADAPVRHALEEVVLDHYDRAFSNQDYQLALDYLGTLSPLYGQDPPRKIAGRLAVAHEKLADQLKAHAQGLKPTVEQVARATSSQWRTAFELSNQEAALHYETAGDYYYKHALMAETEGDAKAFADTLWQSAECYDKAQLWAKAIARYGDYIQFLPEDPRRQTAARRLGLAYLVDGQYQAALGQFLSLAEIYPNSPDTYDSLVPLARCYAEMKDYDAAKRTLNGILENHPAITPQSPRYIDALQELGRLHHQLGEYRDAIARLSQALDLMEARGDNHTAAVRFLLADAYRQSIKELEADPDQALSQAQIAARQHERDQRLDQALRLYDQVITELEQRPFDALGPLEQVYYRDSFFFRADCAFDLRRFKQAIELYDLAARRWEREPASLVALIQIVNAHAELGQVQEARAANRRAQDQLKRIPEDAFNDSVGLMTHRHWEDWLRWTDQLQLRDTTPTASAATP